MDIKSIKNLLVNTPLIDIKYKYNNKIHHVYAKCEWYSLTGSIKDRVAYCMILNAYKEGRLNVGDPIIEVSSGNMGLSLVAIGNLTHNPVTILMPKHMSEERKKLLKLYGATLVETEDFIEAFRLCKEYESRGYFCPRQFDNINNTLAHEKMTAEEIYSKIKNLSVKSFIAGIGTSGTFSGTGRILKKKLQLKIIAIEPKNARIITGKPPYQKHSLQGLSDEKLPALYKAEVCDHVIQISDDDAIAMSRKLCKELSLGVGISSGANFLGCVLSNDDSVTIFPDDNKKYLSTTLSQDTQTPLVDSIELLSFRLL